MQGLSVKLPLCFRTTRRIAMNTVIANCRIGKGTELYVLLTLHLGIIFVNNQLDEQFFFMYVYFYSLHVSGSHVPIIRRINCINTTSGICHSV